MVFAACLLKKYIILQHHVLYRSWPTLHVEALSNKNVKELLRAELVTHGASLNAEEETKVLTHCRNTATCIPLYVMVLSRHIAE